MRVTGYVGGSAEIRCPYKKGYETNSKYLCRGECQISKKDIPVQTQQGETEATNGRFSLHDNSTANTNVFTATITGLTAEDSGKYWCAIKTGHFKADWYAEVADPKLTQTEGVGFDRERRDTIYENMSPMSDTSA
ncbi:hypothetical protein ACEWY4_017268 [Coilia grayii]|uniref:Immunoglobulin V-set domain-containing protein n=1 Tax=Coilia grayii TaxID=363190 RepID=A0ABD1JGD0_9TELE